MDRTLYHQLIQWKNAKNRKPLLLQGARQVGKTFLLKKFGKNTYTKDQHIFPLETKAGISRRKKSLLVYQQKFEPLYLLRASTMNLEKNGAVHNYPLYLISKIPF
jgi:predicted AAA+ superfamily ATPase